MNVNIVSLIENYLIGIPLGNALSYIYAILNIILLAVVTFFNPVTATT